MADPLKDFPGEPIVGIDLGTTNSEIALVVDGQPHVFAADGDPILPSFVGFSAEGKLLVGKAARNQWLLAPERTAKSIKRKMGEDIKVRLGAQEFRPQEISAMILRALRERAEGILGRPVRKAVITVPAFFNDAQRQATREAGELAGLEVLHPQRADGRLAHLRSEQAELRRVLVYDLGGGTFDVSIVQTQQGVVEVLSSHGDTRLGGDDFDELLLAHVCDAFQKEHGVDLRGQAVAHARVLSAAEAAKKALSFHSIAAINEEFIAEKEGRPLHLKTEIRRDDYEAMILPLLEKTLECLRQALEDAQLTPAQIDRVILVGGSTRTPLVSRLLEERLGQPAHQEVNPDLCVAMGAAIQAGLLAGAEVGPVLVDITPHSLGIKALYGPFDADEFLRFTPVLHRNTPLPAARSDSFYTAHDGQDTVEIEVYQGEHEDWRRNHHLGSFFIQGLAPVPAGNELLVQFDLNLDGMLKVSARERATGLAKHITIRNALSQFEDEERDAAQERLDRLWGSDTEEGPAGMAATPPAEPAPDHHREVVQARALRERRSGSRRSSAPRTGPRSPSSASSSSTAWRSRIGRRRGRRATSWPTPSSIWKTFDESAEPR
ncbi:MAG: Hsp70 family protein [Gemmataceae bacterium]